ncbi:MAG: dihydroneopterin aldolase [Planctomycetota bacterium]|jgi:FolB domain-containing protein
MIIRITNLRLRVLIGLNDWEREKKQDIVVNLTLDVDDETSTHTDEIADSVNYKKIKYRIVEEVEQTEFFLIERMAGFILDLVQENPKIAAATVRIDKPHALRYADSVSIELTRNRKQ